VFTAEDGLSWEDNLCRTTCVTSALSKQSCAVCTLPNVAKKQAGHHTAGATRSSAALLLTQAAAEHQMCFCECGLKAVAASHWQNSLPQHCPCCCKSSVPCALLQQLCKTPNKLPCDTHKRSTNNDF
jgi:hypothetical protein